MTTVSIADGFLIVRFSRAEKIAGLLRDLRVPLVSITSAQVVPDGVAATRGIRAPGLGLPRIRHIGTWRGRGRGRTLVSVHGGRPAVRLTLVGEHYSTLLLTVTDGDQLLADLAAAGYPADAARAEAAERRDG